MPSVSEGLVSYQGEGATMAHTPSSITSDPYTKATAIGVFVKGE